MIDRQQRARLALLLRRLASGRLPAPEFEDAYYDLEAARPADAALREIAYFGWTLFSDGDERLTGPYAIGRDARRFAARAVLFLGTAHEYRWPRHPPVLTWRDLVSVLTLGFVRWEHPDWRRWRRAIDLNAWPFASTADAAAAAHQSPFRSEPATPAV